jgi:hypothetical protein
VSVDVRRFDRRDPAGRAKRAGHPARLARGQWCEIERAVTDKRARQRSEQRFGAVGRIGDRPCPEAVPVGAGGQPLRGGDQRQRKLRAIGIFGHGEKGALPGKVPFGQQGQPVCPVERPGRRPAPISAARRGWSCTWASSA